MSELSIVMWYGLQIQPIFWYNDSLKSSEEILLIAHYQMKCPF